MSEAAILNLESYRQETLEQKFRERLHKELDKWLDLLENVMDDREKPSGLWGITEWIRKQREALMGVVARDSIEKEYTSYLDQEYANCPVCGRRLKRQDVCQRTLETMIGQVTVHRPYFYCSMCRHGFYPLDEALNLSSRRKQYDVQEAAADLAKEVPYEKASKLFTKLSGIPMSDHLMHEVVNASGDELNVLDVSPTLDEIAEKIQGVSVGRKWRPIMVLAIDGADVATRPESAKGSGRGRKKHRAKRARWKGEWREAKGFRIYLVDDERNVHLLSWHQVQDQWELAQQMYPEGLIWPYPPSPVFYRPSGLSSMFGLSSTKHWVWMEGSKLVGSLSARPASDRRAWRLVMLASPEFSGRVEASLLARALAAMPLRRSSLLMDYPANLAVETMVMAGFRSERTLTWMKKEL